MTGLPDQLPQRRWFSLADAISLLRLPLALAFALIDDVVVRIAILALAGVTDLGDGWVARRRGGSGLGELLDPVVDKIFAATAFGVVLWLGALAWYEVVAALFRDIVASIAFFITLARGHRTAVPARLGGKVVTACQLFTVLACLLESSWRQPLAWLTAGAALYAVYDYNQPFFRKLRTR